MKYVLLTIDEAHNEKPIEAEDGSPLILGVPNSLNFMKGDEFIIGTGVFVVDKRRFVVGDVGTAFLFLKQIGTKLDIHNLTIGVTTRFP